MPLQVPTHLPELQAGRILLRAMRDDDAPALLAVYGDPAVMRYTDEDPFPDQDTVRRMLRSVRRLLALGESLEWAIVLLDGGALIGTCGLHALDEAPGAAEVGCLLGRAAWGKGYMAEAVGCLAAYARDVLGLDQLKADVAAQNAQAHRLFDKLGFRREDAATWRIDLRGRLPRPPEQPYTAVPKADQHHP